MIEANMPEAKTHLSKLVEAAERGQQVFLKRNGIVVAQIISLPKAKFPFGFLKEKVPPIPDSLLFGGAEDHFDEFTRL